MADVKRLINDLSKALSDEIEFLKEYGGDKKFVCKDGRFLEHRGTNHIYEFVLEYPLDILDDTLVSIRSGNETILGSIVAIEGLKIILSLKENLGDRVPEITVTANPYFLLELLMAKLAEVNDNKLPNVHTDIALKMFDLEKVKTGRDQDSLAQAKKTHLNPEQAEAVSRALGSELCFIWGPPGTGKTEVLSEIAQRLLDKDKTVLIASHTNIAVDNALERIAKVLKLQKNPLFLDGKVLRFGEPQLKSLFSDFPELDVDYWVDKKAEELKQKLFELEDKVKIKESVLSHWLKLKSNLLDTKVAQKKFSDRKDEVHNTKILIESLNQKRLTDSDRLSTITQKLSSTERMSAVGRFFRGLNITRLEKEINTLHREIADNETKLNETKAALENLEQDIQSLDSRLKILEQELERLFAIIGKKPDLREIEKGVETRKKEIGEIKSQIDEIKTKIAKLEQTIIREATILGTTLSKCYLNEGIYAGNFDTVVVDEASMAPMPALFFAACLAQSRAVVVGDFRQLSPIAQGETTEVIRWLRRDIFEESGVRDSFDKGKSDERLVALKEQRRMPTQIAELVNGPIYGGMLRTGKKANVETEIEKFVLQAEPFPDSNIIICDTSAIDPWCTKSPSGSPFNIYSAMLSVYLAQKALAAQVPEGVAIISPYTAQTRLIHELIYDQGIERVDPSSVHKFQGREKQVVIFDLVEGPVRQIKWLSGTMNTDAMRIINVAVTRAKAKLIFVANLNYLHKKLNEQSVLRQILELAREKALIVDSRQLFSFADAEKRRKTRVVSDEHLLSPVFFSEADFYTHFQNDAGEAKKHVVIVSPFMTVNRTTKLETLFRDLVARKVKVYVVTKPTAEQIGHLETQGQEMVEVLKKLGVTLIFKRNMHEKLAIVDEKIIWYGSLNILSHKNTSELMGRFETEKPNWSTEILKLCGISIEGIEKDNVLAEKLKSINASGIGSCPLGHKLVVRKGRNGLFISCSTYPKHEYADNLDAQTIEKIYGPNYFKCDKCGSKMVVRFNRKRMSRFLGCSKYPLCKVTKII